ncbi:hypothetical protein CPAR01_09878 [Colletotrichum paranaense]|uniref:Uncharacterized protein n=2 Tax=Colletotrichum acutatum species complex TaxID=2707335 RepID=A0AAI9UJ12_9PEZI|nr:uncharacterized protein CPAR01_09878 [Colletotrichum paranaense]KAK1458258.1 hypothetical protein CMEL01_15605 [Colletotrichum melonis]KAK1533170.1 hypothetical protein CPAR01_09878 [Colletotrichum paranaense]
MPHCITSIQRARRDHSKGRGTPRWLLSAIIWEIRDFVAPALRTVFHPETLGVIDFQNSLATNLTL